MVVSANSWTSAKVVPQYLPDVPPAADTTAKSRENRPAPSQPLSAISPPDRTQSAAVSQSIIAASGSDEKTGSDHVREIDRTQRTLKPYGVAMLPRSQEASNPHQTDVTTPDKEDKTAKSLFP